MFCSTNYAIWEILVSAFERRKISHLPPFFVMEKKCGSCTANFEITIDDLAFYTKVSPVFRGTKELIPPPTRCPDCRMQRRLAFRNERSLHHRPCSKTGKSIVSMYPATVPFPVYDNDEWWKDSWSALDFGRAYESGNSFMAQFHALMNAVPKMARVQQGENLNSQYTNCTSHNKNCYLIFSSNLDEDCLYGTWVISSRSCMDCQQIVRCELCYECIDCIDCYQSSFLRDCSNCSTSMFLTSCSGCKDCFGCIGLRQKQYCIFNEQHTKDEYEAKLKQLNLGSLSSLSAARDVFRTMAMKTPIRFYEGLQNEDVSGNHITQSRNAFECFDVNSLEDCKWCTNAQFLKDSYDVCYYGASGANELIYEGEGVGHGTNNVLFSKLVWGGSSNMYYCYECFASKNCFGCIGLKHAEYCILNKQCTKEEYETLISKIIERMRKDGEWGEFFPASLSPFGYNESVAHEYFPISQQEAKNTGWNWSDEVEKKEQYMGPIFEIQDDIKNVDDTILKAILLCNVTSRPYKIIPQELRLYREMGIPIPRICPDERHRARMAVRNPRKLWKRPCMKCAKEVETTYAPERSEIIYCDDCYLHTVY